MGILFAVSICEVSVVFSLDLIVSLVELELLEDGKRPRGGRGDFFYWVFIVLVFGRTKGYFCLTGAKC